MLRMATRWLAPCSLCFACSSEAATPVLGSGSNGGSSAAGGSVGSGGRTNTSQGGNPIALAGSSSAAQGGGSVGGACAAEGTSAEVLPVYLAFAFDVSGSMGKGDQPWHDQKLKWDPVAAATTAFFSDSASKGLWASLTFFPTDANSRCNKSSYATPDVPITALPSNVFGTALAKIPQQAWRGGTPTLAVMQGVSSAVTQAMQTTPGHYVIVLVTDGYPEGCNDNAIASVSAVAAGMLPKVPTYVIGIANPPISGAPDTVSNLNQVAVAGGTQHAFLIDTGNPTNTSSAFGAAVSSIRSASISCEAAIPKPPAGKSFDKRRVAVKYTGNTGTTQLQYDAACSASDAWHYDDANNPTRVVLCANTCAKIQADSSAKLSVEFACEDVIQVPL
ncbi:MAG: vWA domain-containing protein [Polyangiaceae bacterium]